jgi:uncharacterized protein with HEPN domain
MDSRDITVLRKILAETSVISELITGYDLDSFSKDEKTKRAVCMTLINIGELVKLLSDSVKRINPEIPWRSIAGLRDVTAHRYQSLRNEDIWETVTKDVPILREQIMVLATNDFRGQ